MCVCVCVGCLFAEEALDLCLPEAGIEFALWNTPPVVGVMIAVVLGHHRALMPYGVKESESGRWNWKLGCLLLGVFKIFILI